MQMRKSMLLGTVSAVVMATGASVAQDAATGELDEIVVTGIRGSLMRAIDTKRNANSIVDAVSAEDVGKFPDKNVAETLSHVPGISIDREYGDGEKLALRGTAPEFTKTMINGQTIASADWFILDSPGRAVNFTLLPPEIVGTIEVYKTSEARLDEGGTGGTVIVNTRKPLDLPAGTLRLGVEAQYNDLSDKTTPNASGLYSWQNDEGTFGVITSLAYQQQKIRRDGFEIFSFQSFPVDPSDPDSATAPGINAHNAAYFQQTRTRTAATLGLQFRPNEQLDISLNGFYVNAKYNNFNQSRYAFNGHGRSRAALESSTVNGGIITGQTFGADGQVFMDAILREAEVELYSVDGKLDYANEDWSFSLHAGKTKADGGTKQQSFVEWNWSDGYTFDISDAANNNVGNISFDQDPTDGSYMPAGFAQSRQQPTSDGENYAQADIERFLDAGALKSIAFGAKYKDHTTTQDARLSGVPVAGETLASFSGGNTPSDFGAGLGASEDFRQWLTAGEDQVKSFIASSGVTLNPFPNAAFDVNEKIFSAYTQVNFEGDRFRGNVGLRYVDTKQKSTGVASGTLTTFENDYSNWLPSFNIAFDASEDVVLRAGASRTLTRANFSQLAAFVSLTENPNAGSGGNPHLQPIKSTNLDLSAEWYMSDDSLLSVALFHKDLSTYIYNQTVDEQHVSLVSGNVETFAVNRPNNGGGGKLKGFELSFQKNFENGFGIQANYTYTDSSTEDNLDIPFSSKHVYNITPYYENDDFSARVTYGYRSKYFRATGREGTAITNDPYKTLDAAVAYHVTDQISVTAQAQNLLNELQYHYNNGDRNQPVNAYKNGRKFFLGVRFAY